MPWEGPPEIADEAAEVQIDFSASCVIDDPERGGSEPGAWALALMFSPLHSTTDSPLEEYNHEAR